MVNKLLAAISLLSVLLLITSVSAYSYSCLEDEYFPICIDIWGNVSGGGANQTLQEVLETGNTFTTEMTGSGNITTSGNLTVGSTGSEHTFFIENGAAQSSLTIENFLWFGVFNVAMISGIAHGGLASVFGLKNGLFVVGIDQDPTITFLNNIGSQTAGINFNRTSDVLNLVNADEYTMDDSLWLKSALAEGIYIGDNREFSILENIGLTLISCDNYDVTQSCIISSNGLTFREKNPANNLFTFSFDTGGSHGFYRWHGGKDRFEFLDDTNFNNNVTMDQNLDVVGNITGNFYYAEAYNYSPGAVSWNFDIDLADTYYNMTNLTLDDVNGFSFTTNPQATGGSYFTTEISGLYNAKLTISFDSIAVGGLFGIAIVENFNVSLNRDCYSRREAAVEVGNAGVDCLMRLDIGDTVNVQVENENTNRDMGIHTVNLNLIRIGD